MSDIVKLNKISNAPSRGGGGGGAGRVEVSSRTGKTAEVNVNMGGGGEEDDDDDDWTAPPPIRSELGHAYRERKDVTSTDGADTDTMKTDGSEEARTHYYHRYF